MRNYSKLKRYHINTLQQARQFSQPTFTQPNYMGLGINAVKFICAIICAILTFIGSTLVLCIKTVRDTSRAEALAGGVFLGAAFAHLAHDSSKEIFEYHKMEYPLSGALIVSVFVILTTIEILSYSEQDVENQQPDEKSNRESNLNLAYQNENRRVFKLSKHTFNVHTYNYDFRHQFKTYSHLMTHDAFSDNHEDHPFEERPTENHNSKDANQNTEKSNFEHNDKSKMVIFSSTFHSFSVPVTVLYIIMLVHSFIEGLALGIMKQVGGVIALAIAIGGHKPIEAFALGLILVNDRPVQWLYWVMMIAYVAMSPVGIVVAVYISEIGNNLVLGIISAISAGTFVFVGCDEWAKLFMNKNVWSLSEKLWHLGLFAFGVLWMLLIAILDS